MEHNNKEDKDRWKTKKRKKKPNERVKWKILYANIRGVQGKRVSLTEILDDLKPEVVLLAETLLYNNVGIKIKGYKFFGQARVNNNGGGIGILIKNEIKQRIAPHTSDKGIEILWISIDRGKSVPLYVGVYYGKQEKINKEEIMEEMAKLKEEITEIKSEGDVILAMDGNGKVGILGEKSSRNGCLLEAVFQETELCIMNKTEKCDGRITRQNSKNQNEKSAIDFVLSSTGAYDLIEKVTVDETGLHRMKGKCDSDHNSIIIDMNISKKVRKVQKTTMWRLNAPEEKWEAFRRLIAKKRRTFTRIVNNRGISINCMYRKWLQEIEKTALVTIGKTTYKSSGSQKCSKVVQKLRNEKREIKKVYQKELDMEMKKEYLKQYKEKQEEQKERMQTEQREKIQNKFERMIREKNSDMFWKEKKKMSKDETMELLITKDEDGKRIYDPEKNKENIAGYYEKLFKEPVKPEHPYHDIVKNNIQDYMKNEQYEYEPYNKEPSTEIIENIIKKKKNGKATTDLKNEFMKRGEKEMVEVMTELMSEVWRREQIPEKWNEGYITSVWKKKGDREEMKNQRGITVSSGVSTIMEELVNDRIIENVSFTQAQGGGKKGSMTCDHLFILYALISLNKKKRKKIILTFYDVQKAYDHADVHDMLNILWEKGVRGKTWRIVKMLNENLTARIKTRYGMTRKINRETGGKQGGKTTTTMFAKMMDILPEKMMENLNLGVKLGNAKIAALLWVDDVVTIAQNESQQKETLNFVSDFANKHKLTWSADKCNAMELGTHKNFKEKWDLGEEKIEHHYKYKYLGDILMRNGSHAENIEERTKKVKNSTMNVITCGKQDIMRQIEVQTVIKLHEIITIPTMLHNAECWLMTKTECLKYERMEIWALRRLLNLPEKTPCVAIRFVTGTLFTKVRIDQKQLLYLKRILDRGSENWTCQVLQALDTENIGWAPMIREKLNEYSLEVNWENVRVKTLHTWKKEVKNACEEKNKELMLSECQKRAGFETSVKTKSESIYRELQSETYLRTPVNEIMKLNKLKAKTIIMCRYGMLDCGSNFKTKYGTKMCKECNVIDNEDHRINFCSKYIHINRAKEDVKIDFCEVYSRDVKILSKIAGDILKMWNLENGQNTMK